MYVKQVRCLLELAVPAWHGSISQVERTDIERVQKCALHIILGDEYEGYKGALELAGLDTLVVRRDNLCLKFGNKALQDPKHKQWFKPKPKLPTRQKHYKYCKPVARTERLMRGPISYLTNMLNSYV